MFRRENSLDNELMENFFSVLKREMFCDYKDQYKNTDELIQEIHQYIQYYNNDKIKVKLKGLIPGCLANKVSNFWVDSKLASVSYVILSK